MKRSGGDLLTRRPMSGCLAFIPTAASEWRIRGPAEMARRPAVCPGGQRGICQGTAGRQRPPRVYHSYPADSARVWDSSADSRRVFPLPPWHESRESQTFLYYTLRETV